MEAVREANAILEPRAVAEWLVREANHWFAAPCWAVIGRDAGDQLVILADSGMTPSIRPAVWSAADWVMLHSTELFTADLAKDVRGTTGSGAAVAFPLLCRNRAIGALIALDPAPCKAAPKIGASLLMSLRAFLEPTAIALDNAVAVQRAEALSVTDDLTRLYNSRYLNQVLKRETKRATRSNQPLSVLFLDLDGFKQVNDNHGHQAGSKCLVEAAAVIRGCGRETDVVARFGGDEFSLILPDTGPDGAFAVAVRIKERLRAARFLESDGLSVRLTASIGVATLPKAAESAEDLLRAADVAMYKVKAAGKDGIHVA